MGVGALPRQGEGDQPRMAGRRFDHVAVAAGRGRAELERAGGLHRAAPHVDRVVEHAGDDRHRMEPQVAADRGVVEARAPGGPPGVRSAPAATTTCGARTTRRPRAGGAAHRGPGTGRAGRRIDDEDAGLDADRPAALEQHPRDARPVDDPGARRPPRREVGPDPGLLRPARAAERAAAAVAAVDARCAGSGPPPSRVRPHRGGSPRPSAG